MSGRLALLLIAGTFCSNFAFAHGSVTPEDDLCIIRIGYYRAHFKVYLPQQTGHAEYCEDVPGTGEAVFVMEYEHSGLGAVPIDFRIIRNATGNGVYTNEADIQRLGDLDRHTVFHHPAAIQSDVFTALHHFDAEGEFVGIVTVRQPESGRLMTAIFPFEVGFTGFGWWPWFVVIAAVLQINYLWMSGRLRQWSGAK